MPLEILSVAYENHHADILVTPGMRWEDLQSAAAECFGVPEHDQAWYRSPADCSTCIPILPDLEVAEVLETLLRKRELFLHNACATFDSHATSGLGVSAPKPEESEVQVKVVVELDQESSTLLVPRTATWREFLRLIRHRFREPVLYVELPHAVNTSRLHGEAEDVTTPHPNALAVDVLCFVGRHHAHVRLCRNRPVVAAGRQAHLKLY